MTFEPSPAWTSLHHLRAELARTEELVGAILERFEEIGFVEDDVQADKDEKAIEWAEAEHVKAHSQLEHRELELIALWAKVV